MFLCLPILCLVLSLGATSSIPRHNRLPTAKAGRATYIGLNDPVYSVDSWLAIRYAQPPLKSLRLQPPKPYKARGTIKAQNFGDRCFQLPIAIDQSEDCLTLNIYTPSQACASGKDHRSGLPVMLWIHGGSFNQGSGSLFPPQALIRRSVKLKSPVIVVTINYRLSFLGFSAGKVATANNALNLGLLDQRQAMHWVKRHISAFGGDPAKVTIFGQSAGATSIGLHMTANHEDKLFRGAILESGSPANTLPTPPPTWPTYQAAWDAVVAGIGCTDSAKVFTCVQRVPSEILFPVIQEVSLRGPLPASVWPWQPVVDGNFIKDFPSKLIAAGNFAKVPMIMGFTTDELTYVIPTNLNISCEADIIQFGQIVLPQVPTSIMAQMLALEPLTLYPATNVTVKGGLEWKRATEIASDLFERCPGREWIQNVTKYSPAWKYRWNAILPEQIANEPELGIVHSAELIYVFGPSYAPYTYTPYVLGVELVLSRQVQKAWISFAAHLDPNALGPISPGVFWPKWNNKMEQVLVFQKPDGALGTPVGQGLHLEKDPDDRPACDFFAAHDSLWVH